MSDYVIRPGDIEKWALGRHVGVDSRLLVDGANLTVVYTQWEPGATAPEHVHPHEQVGVCLQGNVVLTIAGEDHSVGPGEFYHIPGNVPHAERNPGFGLAVLADFFSPVRDDLVRREFEARVVGAQSATRPEKEVERRR
jgi:quercetin dioxygenase-like cupin family protein